MAKTAVVTEISMETCMIKVRDGQYVNEYSFNHPYTSNAGKYIAQGAATYLKDQINVGDTVEYSYADDNGLKYLKFLKLAAPGGAPQSNATPYQAPQPKSPSQYSGAAQKPAKSFDSPEKQQMIYRQHAEKLLTEFLAANPEFIDTKDGALSTEIAFLDMVSKLSDIFVQRFCVTYGLQYINHKP